MSKRNIGSVKDMNKRVKVETSSTQMSNSGILLAKEIARLKSNDAICDRVLSLTQSEFKSVLDVYNQHYEQGKPLLEDVTYDNLERLYLREFPGSKYNRTRVYALVGNNKIKVVLPRLMPSLSKAKKPEELSRFYEKHPNKDEVKNYTVITDKENGLSAQLTWNEETKKLMLLSHGDGTNGVDWSHMFLYLNNIPSQFQIEQSMRKLSISEFRGELIMRNDLFELIRKNPPVGTRPGTTYKNVRNTVFGAVNSEADSMIPDLLKMISFVVYETYYVDEDSKATVEDRLEDAKNCGFEIPATEVCDHPLTYEEAQNLTLQRKAKSSYAIDGIVIAINHLYRVQGSSFEPRSKPKVLGTKLDIKEDEEGEDLDKPDYVIAFKVDTLFATTTVKNVEWNATRFAKRFPRIMVESVWMDADHDKATGKTAVFIESNCIEPGTVVVLEKSGDIIPNVHEVKSKGPTGKGQFPPQFDEVTGAQIWDWDENHVNIYYLDPLVREVQLARLIAFFTTFKANGMQEGVVTKLFNHYYTSDKSRKSRTHGPLAEILSASASDFLAIEGFKATLAEKIHSSIQLCKNNVTLSRLMDSSSLFEEGFGTGRFTTICKKYPDVLTWDTTSSRSKYDLAVSKMNDLGLNILAIQFVKHLPAFQAWVKDLPMITVAAHAGEEKKQAPLPKATFGGSSGALMSTNVSIAAGEELPKIVCFSGFRNADWENMIVRAGGKVNTSVSGKTDMLVVADRNEKSTKIRNAEEKGVPILTKNEFATKYKLKVQHA
jgi:NAD-dependent DNA ligase